MAKVNRSLFTFLNSPFDKINANNTFNGGFHTYAKRRTHNDIPCARRMNKQDVVFLKHMVWMLPFLLRWTSGRFQQVDETSRIPCRGVYGRRKGWDAELGPILMCRILWLSYWRERWTSSFTLHRWRRQMGGWWWFWIHANTYVWNWNFQPPQEKRVAEGGDLDVVELNFKLCYFSRWGEWFVQGDSETLLEQSALSCRNGTKREAKVLEDSCCLDFLLSSFLYPSELIITWNHSIPGYWWIPLHKDRSCTPESMQEKCEHDCSTWGIFRFPMLGEDNRSIWGCSEARKVLLYFIKKKHLVNAFYIEWGLAE